MRVVSPTCDRYTLANPSPATSMPMRFPTTIALLVLTCVLCDDLSAQDERPNIVLIMSDYMGYADTEPYGATDISTPSLSRLAAEGVRMTDFYAAAPVCGPARAALMTGKYPARIGFESNIRTETDGIGGENATLAQHLNNAGYRTALYGKVAPRIRAGIDADDARVRAFHRPSHPGRSATIITRPRTVIRASTKMTRYGRA